MTGDTPRHIRPDEASVVAWMLTHASAVGPLNHLVATVPALDVFDRCRCGCGSLHFSAGDPCDRRSLIASAMSTSPSGATIEVHVWGTQDAVTGLEVLGDPTIATGLPSLGTLQPFVLS